MSVGVINFPHSFPHTFLLPLHSLPGHSSGSSVSRQIRWLYGQLCNEMSAQCEVAEVEDIVIFVSSDESAFGQVIIMKAAK